MSYHFRLLAKEKQNGYLILFDIMVNDRILQNYLYWTFCTVTFCWIYTFQRCTWKSTCLPTHPACISCK